MADASTERDSLDFRDLLYRPTLAPLGAELWPKVSSMRVRDQGIEGACAGFGLAATIDYLSLLESKTHKPVSARMLYEMGKRHDRWPGSDYEGTTARGVMKGWHKNGVCLESKWPYMEDEPGHLSRERAEDALQAPLGAYYRVLPRRPDVHAALVEVGAVFATAAVHAGWNHPKRGRILWDGKAPDEETPGHAFAILGYTKDGFLVQNSWGKSWGGLTHRKQRFGGLGLWSYADFDAHVWDLWVARRARPVESLQALAAGWLAEGNLVARPSERAPAQFAIRDDYVHLDDGVLMARGDYPTQRDNLAESIRRQLRDSRCRHVLLYAHGGLNTLKASARRIEQWKPVLRGNGIYGLHFLWETGFWEELRDVLLGKQAATQARAGGSGTWWDRWIESGTGWAGRALWREMREDAALAFAGPASGGSQALELLAREWTALPKAQRPKIHLAGHSAGALFLGYLLQAAESLPLVFDQMVLLAPANNLGHFDATLRPALESGRLKQLTNIVLDDLSERRDNVAGIYGKSLLYLVSRAYEDRHSVQPLFGMARYMDSFRLQTHHDRLQWVTPFTDPALTMARSHAAFDNDVATMNTLLEQVLGKAPRPAFQRLDLVD